MNKIALCSIVVSVGLMSSGCQPIEQMPTVNEVPTASKSMEIDSIVDLSDKVKFLSKSEGIDILTISDDIFLRLSEYEGKLIFGEIDFKDNEKKKKLLYDQLLEWDKNNVDLALKENQQQEGEVGQSNSESTTSSGNTSLDDVSDGDVAVNNIDKSEEDKLLSLVDAQVSDIDKVTSIVIEIEKGFSSISMILPDEIKIFKYNSIFIDEQAFTIGNSIFLSKDIIEGHKQVLKEELIRQLTYVYLNNNDEKASKLYSAFGFVKCPELLEISDVGNVHINPSYPIIKYAFDGVYKGKSIKFVPVEILDYKLEVTSDGNEINRLVKETKFYAVDINEESAKLIKFDDSFTINENGKPLGVNIEDMDNFYNYFTDTHDVNNSPKKIVADYIVGMFTSRGNNDTKIYNMIISIISN